MSRPDIRTVGAEQPAYLDLAVRRGRHRTSAYAERLVRSIKSEYLGKLVLLDENHLRTAVREYVAHYHTERNHEGLEGRLIEPTAKNLGTEPIDCRERLGGLLRFYHRQAA